MHKFVIFMLIPTVLKLTFLPCNDGGYRKPWWEPQTWNLNEVETRLTVSRRKEWEAMNSHRIWQVMCAEDMSGSIFILKRLCDVSVRCWNYWQLLNYNLQIEIQAIKVLSVLLLSKWNNVYHATFSPSLLFKIFLILHGWIRGIRH